MAEIRFAQDIFDPRAREAHEKAIRSTFAACGLFTGQDIIDSGCIGLYTGIGVGMPGTDAIAQARFVREHMSGSVCGLPCYVPPDRFCLIHNTVGGLQKGQTVHSEQSLAACSRPLTNDEAEKCAHLAGLVDKEGADDLRKFGAEVVEEDVPAKLATIAEAATVSIPGERPVFAWQCPEHVDFNWKCKYCRAQAIVEGPHDPPMIIQVARPSEGEAAPRAIACPLPDALAMPGVARVDFFVQVAKWVRKLTRE